MNPSFSNSESGLAFPNAQRHADGKLKQAVESGSLGEPEMYSH